MFRYKWLVVDEYNTRVFRSRFKGASRRKCAELNAAIPDRTYWVMRGQ